MRFFQGLIVALTLLVAAAAQDVTRERVEDLLERAGIQRELPGEPGALPDDGPSRSSDWNMPSLGAGVAQAAFWLFVGCAGVFLLVLIVRAFSGRRAPAEGRSGKVRLAGERPAEPPPPREVPEHSALAAAGDFAAAVHALLQKAFALWEAKTRPLPQRATGRDVLRVVRAAKVESDALAALVGAVERVHFGGRPADQVLYEASCERLAQWEAQCRGAK